MNVAVVGGSGYIAGFLLQRFYREPVFEKIITLGRGNKVSYYLDLLRPEEFNYKILKGIDYVVFTAAISGPDKCAVDSAECWNVNVTGTAYFIRKAMEYGCRILFLSSDSVFGSSAEGIYDERSGTNADTPYGRMKKAIEDEFKASPLFKAIRLSYVVSTKDKFTAYCLNCIKNGDVAEIFHPFYRNCIIVSDVVDVVLWFAFHFNEYKPHVLNVAGSELVSRVRIADEINRMLSGKLLYKIVKPDDKFFENRPQITQMRSVYMHEYEILKDISFTEKMQKELKEIINEY